MTSGPALALLASPVRRDILRVLSALPLTPLENAPRTRREGLTASELGERLSLHVTTIRFHVDQMRAAGLLVARDVPIGVGRPRRFYSAHPGHVSGDAPDGYRLVAEILADACRVTGQPGPPDAVAAAARDWAARQTATAWWPTPRRPPPCTCWSTSSGAGGSPPVWTGQGRTPRSS